VTDAKRPTGPLMRCAWACHRLGDAARRLGLRGPAIAAYRMGLRLAVWRHRLAGRPDLAARGRRLLRTPVARGPAP
jgi:hypothetical protein